MHAVCPDGRRVKIRVPEGGGYQAEFNRTGRHLIFFHDLPTLIWD